jgi:hypothetical protein
MYKLSTDKKIAVISALVEGCSVRSTVRLTGVSKGAVLRLLASVGKACADYQNATIRNIPAKRVQVDEIWSFLLRQREERHAGYVEARWVRRGRLDLHRD